MADAPDDAAAVRLLSLAIPVHNEEANLRTLWSEIQALLEALPVPAEVIFVNDASTDTSSDILGALMTEDARVRVVDHPKNAGLTAALNTGFRHAHGDVVGMLDADMQNPPMEIAKLFAALPGHDMVIGWRKERDDPWIKRVSSKIANAYRNKRTNEQVHDTGCGLKVFRRKILDDIKLWNGMHRFLPTLARMEGYTIHEVVVAHRPRGGGKSHFGVWNRLWKGLADVRTIRWMWKNRLPKEATERSRGLRCTSSRSRSTTPSGGSAKSASRCACSASGVASEKAKRSVVPASFWWLSLAGTACLIVYFFHRKDPVFLVGALINGALYVRNLMLLHRPRETPRSPWIPLLAGLLLFAALSWVSVNTGKVKLDFDMPRGWLIFGFVFQAIWSTRFVVQWVLSERLGRSHLPASFFWISLIGCIGLFIYAVARVDWVMMAAFVLNPIPYVRNLMLMHRAAGAPEEADK